MTKLERPPVSACLMAVPRPRVQGKFIFVGDEKLYIRGVTYGTFRPDEDGHQYPRPEAVERDFAQMAANGINAIRTYTVPPQSILDAAQRHGLWVMVGLPWEQHIAFLDDKKRAQAIEERVRAGVRACAHHPAILCYAVGNEIPASIVRWHGRRRVVNFLKRLYLAVKAEDPNTPVTYVNYPSTEYLQLPFVDFVCFNVYLESQTRLEAYLARLQNIAGDRPLVIAEVGLDSRQHGEDAQARALDWQIRTAFAAGCAGTFAFTWTDEWYRGGYEIEDWDFGLTTRDRQPKPALAAVRQAYTEVPFPADLPWPRISVVVCSYNGARTIRECFEGLRKLEYPNYEVIVVNDGSTDTTAAIADQYDFRLISTENRGLSSARNTGMEAATGEIIAYIDDDAYPDPHWLTYLAASFMSTTHAGIGGPNIAPPNDGFIADCVANAPGGPIHVLLSDQEAEHIPGCNMAFRKSCLQKIGGFDVQFRVAGDDVDVCWRVQQQGWTLGFSPSAVVWHHRRNSVRTYWKQQVGYGRAEALLEKKWPEKYNAIGHVVWAGRLYGKGLTHVLSMRRGRIYQGTWGSALFQTLDHPVPSTLTSLPLMPEWYLIIGLLAALSALSFSWTPKLAALPLLVLAAAALVIQASLSASYAASAKASYSHVVRLKFLALTTFLHLSQPLARLRGRLRHGLTPWRQHGVHNLSWPGARTFMLWSEQWRSSDEWLHKFELALRAHSVVVRRGGDYDSWDLEVQCGILGAVRVQMAVEEHGAGRQLLRFRSWPRWSPSRLSLILLFAGLSTGAAVDHAWAACAILGGTASLLVIRKIHERAVAMAAVFHALSAMERGHEKVSQLQPQSEVSRLRIFHSLARSNGHSHNAPHRAAMIMDDPGGIESSPQLGPSYDERPPEPIKARKAQA